MRENANLDKLDQLCADYHKEHKTLRVGTVIAEEIRGMMTLCFATGAQYADVAKILNQYRDGKGKTA